MTNLTDDEVLARLAQALRADPIEPSGATWASLESALAGSLAASPARNLGLLRGRRVPALAITLVSVLTVSGAAAAAVATNTLPGPLRSLAYNLGLPVTSPALYQAQGEEATLRDTLQSHREARAHAIGEALARRLRTLDRGDRASIVPSADGLLRRAGVSVTGTVTTTTTTTTTAPNQDGDSNSSGDQGGGASDQSGSQGDSSGAVTVTTTVTVTIPSVPDLGNSD